MVRDLEPCSTKAESFMSGRDARISPPGPLQERLRDREAEMRSSRIGQSHPRHLNQAIGRTALNKIIARPKGYPHCHASSGMSLKFMP
jgi:hypothetical protein